MSPQSTHSDANLDFERSADGVLTLRLGGVWTLDHERPSTALVDDEIARGGVTRIAFDTTGVSRWDTGMLSFLKAAYDAADQHGITADISSLPDGIRRLIVLATATHADMEERELPQWIARLGGQAARLAEEAWSLVDFIGETTMSIGRYLRHKAQIQRGAIAEFVQQAGFDALPIVSLINFLVGTILAFIGALQLQKFGAELYVANLVGIAMAREMGAMMTAIIMAGRTGAAYAAQLGTMTVNEEIDALKTLGISPMDFLVLPRLLALAMMMPLLTLYADFVGIVGGALVSKATLDISYTQFFVQVKGAVTPATFIIGLFKGGVYGILVAIAGCFSGIRSGRSASAVGKATTDAVVMALIMIITASAVMTVLFNIIGI